MSMRSILVEKEIGDIENLDQKVGNAYNVTAKMAEGDFSCERDSDNVARLQEIKGYLLKFANLQQEVKNFKEATIAMKQKMDESKTDLKEEEIRDMFSSFIDKTRSSVIPPEQMKFIQDVSSTCGSEIIINRHNASADGDFEVLENIESYIDPFLKQRIVDPLRSKTCHHCFEKSSIEKYLMKGPKKCPYVGCSNRLKLADMQEDLQLKAKLATIPSM